MLKKRLIFALLYHRGRFMLSRNFRLQNVGDLAWLQKNYDFANIAFSIDELFVADVSRGERDRAAFCECLKRLTRGCFVPMAAGGGVRSVADARMLLRSGADKIVLNSALADDPALVRELAAEFGQQCIVASIDVQRDPDGTYRICVENGGRRLEGSLSAYLEMVTALPVGEIYLNSMDRDGTGNGYDLGMLSHLPAPIRVPVIIAGGAGNFRHFVEGLADPRIDAVATAHLFNFVGDGLQRARRSLLDQHFDLPVWDVDAFRGAGRR